MILNNKDRLVLNHQSVTSPHNEPQKSPGFVQKQPPEIFCEKSALKNFANFAGKYLCWSLFLITLLVFRPATLLKKYRSSHQRWCSIKRAVLKNFAINTGKHLFVKVIGLQACNFVKKRVPHGCFSVNVVKFLRTPTLKNTCEQLLLKILQQWCFPLKFAKFLRTPILKNICKRLLLFVSPQNTITNSGGEFGLDETSTDCILFNQMQLYNLYVS